MYSRRNPGIPGDTLSEKNTYLAIIQEKAMKDFSASWKCFKAGFNYPPDTLIKASARISDAKAPAIHKSTV